MTNDEILSQTISCLRFPLIVCVVFIHFDLAGGLTVQGVSHGLDNPNWYFFIIRLISEVIATIAVPLFFIISGFLFFNNNHFNIGVYKRKMHSRFKTLLVPYILWNVIAIIWTFKCFIPGVSSFYPPVEIKFSFIRLFHTFFYDTNYNGIIFYTNSLSSTHSVNIIAPINLPLWYLRDLMVMVILSPMIYVLLKKMKFYPVVLFGLIWIFSAYLLPAGWAYLKMFLVALFFFSWGAYFNVCNKNVALLICKAKYAPLFYFVLVVTDALTKGAFCNEFIHKVGILLGVISVVVMVSYLIREHKVQVNPLLNNSSFFIFSLHYLIIRNIGKIIFIALHVPESNPYAMLTLYCGVPFLTIFVCIVFYLLMKHYLPQFCNILSGSRLRN